MFKLIQVGMFVGLFFYWGCAQADYVGEADPGAPQPGSTDNGTDGSDTSRPDTDQGDTGNGSGTGDEIGTGDGTGTGDETDASDDTGLKDTGDPPDTQDPDTDEPSDTGDSPDTTPDDTGAPVDTGDPGGTDTGEEPDTDFKCVNTLQCNIEWLGTICCENRCINPLVNAEHCGSCKNDCTADKRGNNCMMGTCVCGPIPGVVCTGEPDQCCRKVPFLNIFSCQGC